jgi:hypothetical protein
MKTRTRLGSSLALLLVAVLAGSCSSSPDASEDDGILHGDSADGEDIASTTQAWSIGMTARALRGLAITPVPVSIAGRSFAAIERIGEGSYLVNAAGDCSGCHTSDPAKFLAGGTPFPIDGTNVVFTRNLTPDPSTGLALTEHEFIEALRTGKDFHHPGQILVVMPWLQYRWLSRSDLRAIYAYLRAIPGVSNAVPPDVKATSVLNGAPLPFPDEYDEGEVVRSLPHEKGDPDNVRRGLAIRPLNAPKHVHSLSHHERALVGRGSYLANVGTCNDCHTNPDRQLVRAAPDFGHVNTAAYLSGGRVFDVPPPLQIALGQRRTMTADLTGATHGFFNEPEDSFKRFVAVIDSGTHVDETPPRALGWPMPWDHFRLLLRSDKRALYTYLKTIPGRTGAADKETQDWTPYCAGDGDCAATEAPSCNVAANECVAKNCTTDLDCFVCQTCTSGTCAAPLASSACLTAGF